MPYQDEGIFAKFTFFYRSEGQHYVLHGNHADRVLETLRKFHFDGFPAAREARRLDQSLALVTPLSIKNRRSSRPKPAKSRGTAFEERGLDDNFERPDEQSWTDEGTDNAPRMNSDGVDDNAVSKRENFASYSDDSSHGVRIKEERQSPPTPAGVVWRGKENESPRIKEEMSPSAIKIPSPLAGEDTRIKKEHSSSSFGAVKSWSSAAGVATDDGNLDWHREGQQVTGVISTAENTVEHRSANGFGDESASPTSPGHVDQTEKEVLSALEKVTLGKRGRDSDGDDKENISVDAAARHSMSDPPVAQTSALVVTTKYGRRLDLVTVARRRRHTASPRGVSIGAESQSSHGQVRAAKRARKSSGAEGESRVW